MHDLAPLTPLGASDTRTDSFDGLDIAERTDRALASLSSRVGREADTARAVETFLGFALPGPGSAVSGAPYSAIWLGPESWMIDADHGAHELLASEMKSALGDAASVVEQTDAWCRFDLSGPASCPVLERLCNVDTAKMAAGTATRTRLEHVNALLWCLEQGRGYAVLGPRSSAASLHHALVAAAQSVL